MDILDVFKIENIYIVIKIALIVFSILHIFAIATVYSQIKRTLDVVHTHSGKSILLFTLIHVILLSVVLTLIIILPSQ